MNLGIQVHNGSLDENDTNAVFSVTNTMFSSWTGHTTLTCPHRVAMEHGVIPAPRRNTNTSLDYVFQSQVKGKISMVRSLIWLRRYLLCSLLPIAIFHITPFLLVPDLSLLSSYQC